MLFYFLLNVSVDCLTVLMSAAGMASGIQTLFLSLFLYLCSLLPSITSALSSSVFHSLFMRQESLLLRPCYLSLSDLAPSQMRICLLVFSILISLSVGEDVLMRVDSGRLDGVDDRTSPKVAARFAQPATLLQRSVRLVFFSL